MNITLGITHYNRPNLLKELLEKLNGLPDNFTLCVVDDFSTESNYNLVYKFLKNTGYNFELVRHKKNLGPGAAKNSTFKNSNTDYVFILDSDNGINAASLQYINNYAEEHMFDIIAPSSTKYFSNGYKATNIVFNRNVSLSNMRIFLLGDDVYNNGNFLISRNAWEKVHGYPEYHTLDTQGFGFRLRVNNIRYHCVTGATYYHRYHKVGKNSRFMQTSMSGMISLEQICIFLEYFGLLPLFIQRHIMEFPVLRKSTWNESFFTSINTLLNNTTIDTKNEKNTIDISRTINDFITGKSDQLDYSENDECSMFISFIRKLGNGFTNKSNSEKKDIIFGIESELS